MLTVLSRLLPTLCHLPRPPPLHGAPECSACADQFGDRKGQSETPCASMRVANLKSRMSSNYMTGNYQRHILADFLHLHAPGG